MRTSFGNRRGKSRVLDERRLGEETGSARKLPHKIRQLPVRLLQLMNGQIT